MATRQRHGHPAPAGPCWADYYGIPFREAPHDAIDFGLLTAAAMAGARLGAAADVGWRLCEAVYGSDVWPIDEALCVRVARAAGLEPTTFRATLHDPETTRLLAENAREATIAARSASPRSSSASACSGATTGSSSCATRCGRPPVDPGAAVAILPLA